MTHSEDSMTGPRLAMELSMTDDPRVVEEQTRAEYTNHVVPPTARMGRWAVFSGWSSIASALAFVYYGALSASLVGVQQAVIGITITVVVYSVLGTKSAKEAIRWGLNSTLLSRDLFGFRGAALAPLLIATAALYYAVFESSVLAVALQSFFQFWDIRVWYAIVIAGMLPLMLGGMQTWLSKLNGISLPVYFFGLIAAVVVAGIRFGWEGDWSAFEPADSVSAVPGWVTVFVLYMGVWLLFPDTQDTARFSRRKDVKFHGAFSFGWVFYCLAFLFNGLVGIFIVVLAAPDATSESGVVQGIITSIGAFGLIVIIVSQMRINSANFYFASVNMERFVAHFSRRNLSRRAWVVALSAVVFALMFTNVFSYISLALAWQAVLLVSWVGIMLAHWFIDRNKVPEFRPARLRAVAPGFVVWVISSAGGITLLQLPAQVPTLSAIAPIVSLASSIILYGVVRMAGLSARKPAQPDPVRDEIQNLWNTRVRCHECDLSYVAFEIDTARDGERVLCLDCQSRD